MGLAYDLLRPIRKITLQFALWGSCFSTPVPLRFPLATDFESMAPLFNRCRDARSHPKNNMKIFPMNPAVTLDSAIAAHSRWKMKFRTAISKREPVDPATLDKSECELQNWLTGAGHDLYHTRPEFQKLVATHDAFHIEAAKVAQTLTSGRFGEADAMIAPGTPFSRASSDIQIALSVLSRSVG